MGPDKPTQIKFCQKCKSFIYYVSQNKHNKSHRICTNLKCIVFQSIISKEIFTVYFNKSFKLIFPIIPDFISTNNLDINNFINEISSLTSSVNKKLEYEHLLS